MNKEDIEELRDAADEALSTAKLDLSRSKEMHVLHPLAGNDKYITLDKDNVDILNGIMELVHGLKTYPDEE